MELTSQEAKSFIEKIAPRLGSDFTRPPQYPEGRNDIAIVSHSAENGRDYGYDVLYLVWKEADGTIRYRELANSRATKDYLSVRSFTVEGDQVNVQFGSGGSFSGTPWEKTKVHDLKTASTTEVTPTDYAGQANKAMLNVVEENAHQHPLYQPTHVVESVIDAERKRAAFILFEQIDTDRQHAQSEGWLGDQFRYSIWKLNGDNKPVQLYEDHAYIRPRSISAQTGTRGRDCSLKGLAIEGDAIKVLHSKAKVVENPPEWETLTFSF